MKACIATESVTFQRKVHPNPWAKTSQTQEMWLKVEMKKEFDLLCYSVMYSGWIWLFTHMGT